MAEFYRYVIKGKQQEYLCLLVFIQIWLFEIGMFLLVSVGAVVVGSTLICLLVSLDSAQMKSNDCDKVCDDVEGKMKIMHIWNSKTVSALCLLTIFPTFLQISCEGVQWEPLNKVLYIVQFVLLQIPFIL